MPWKECSVMDEPGDYVLNNLCFNFQIGTNGLPSKFNTAILTGAKVVFITACRTTSVFTDRWNMELAHGMCSPEPLFVSRPFVKFLLPNYLVKCLPGQLQPLHLFQSNAIKRVPHMRLSGTLSHG